MLCHASLFSASLCLAILCYGLPRTLLCLALQCFSMVFYAMLCSTVLFCSKFLYLLSFLLSCHAQSCPVISSYRFLWSVLLNFSAFLFTNLWIKISIYRTTWCFYVQTKFLWTLPHHFELAQFVIIRSVAPSLFMAVTNYNPICASSRS